MKKTYQYIALAVLTLGMAACSQEDDFIPQGNQKGAPLAIASAGVADLTTRATITTIEETDYLTGGSMGVFVKSDNTNTRYKGDNLEWNYNGSWKPAGTTVLYEADATKQTIGAYYPYTAELTDGTCAIELPETFGDDYEDYDYLYADHVAVSTNPMSIQMNHLFSKVTVSVAIKGSTIDNNDAVKSVSLSNVPRTAVWAVPTAILSNYGSADQMTVLYANDVDNNETVDNYVGFAFPNEATTLNLRVEMESGRVFRGRASISGGMTDGVHYEIGLNVGKDKMEVSTVSVVPWGTGADIEDGVANEYLPNIDGTEYASLTDLQDAVKDKLSQEGVTSVTVGGYLSEGMHAAIISAINEVKDEGAVTNGSLLAGSVTYTVHATFADALTAWTDGTTLTLLSNTDEYPDDVTIENKTIALDLNGYKLSFNSTDNMCIRIEETGTLTIRDIRGGGEYSAYHLAFFVNGILNIEGGTIHNSVGIQRPGVVNMTGGMLYGNNKNGPYAGADVYGTFNMSGGTISSRYVVWDMPGSVVNISGDAILTATDKLFSGNEGSVITITGGTWSHAPSAYVDTENYIVTPNEDDTWSVTAKE